MISEGAVLGASEKDVLGCIIDVQPNYHGKNRLVMQSGVTDVCSCSWNDQQREE